MTPPFPLIGHTTIQKALLQDVQADNVAHAYLFAGPKAVGKFSTARWFAGVLLSVDDPAQEERIADQVLHLLHPDILSLDQLWIEDVCEDAEVIARSSNISQQHRNKAKTRTDTIGIDDVRALQERLHEVTIGRFRCCLIRSVERMQAEGVNALLKILEEPPPGVVFLLTTESLPSLLPTLISRTRVLHFSRLSRHELQPLFAEVPPEEARFLLHLAQGAPGIIQQLLSSPERTREERCLHAQALSFWHASSLAEHLRLLQPLHDRGAGADRFLLHLALALREELSTSPSPWSRALQELTEGMESNASRPLLAQRFALALV